MSINMNKIKELEELVDTFFRNKHIIVLDPKEEIYEKFNENIVYDTGIWELPEELSRFVSELSKNNEIGIEEKILKIYEKICQDYVYDDNLISYIKKLDEESFDLPDWYGRNVDEEWKKNRERHNRRTCFELSRYLAKSLKQLLNNNKDYSVCIFWNKNLTHYFVGVTCDEYSLTLDVDDFFLIKDLTRIKTVLTAEGIKILKDEGDRFKSVLEKFNSNKSKYSIEKIGEEVCNHRLKTEEKDEPELNDDNIVFLKKVMEVLVEKYNLDSQGIFEYMKEIVDIRIGKAKRRKIWKKIDGENTESNRYIRCLVLLLGDKMYLVDTEDKKMRIFYEDELDKKRTKFIRYNELSRGNFDFYDGR